jgi:hypothetical protein
MPSRWLESKIEQTIGHSRRHYMPRQFADFVNSTLARYRVGDSCSSNPHLVQIQIDASAGATACSSVSAETNFGDVLSDVLLRALQEVTSLHISVRHWS